MIPRRSAPREKPEKKVASVEKKPKKRGRPKKGEERPEEPTRLERQAAGQSLSAMIAELPKACNVGTKKNSKGYKTSWTGYKLHIDAADGGIPASCLLTSASVHDSQAAMPLAQISHGRATSLYDMMDAAYDAPQIQAYSRALGHVPIIDPNPRSKDKKEELKAEAKRRKEANYTLAEDLRYREHSTVERVNGRIKDEFGRADGARTRSCQGHGAFDVRDRGADRGSTDEVYGMIGINRRLQLEKHGKTAVFWSPLHAVCDFHC